jgi:PAS domain S-box-containing protein
MDIRLRPASAPICSIESTSGKEAEGLSSPGTFHWSEIVEQLADSAAVLKWESEERFSLQASTSGLRCELIALGEVFSLGEFINNLGGNIGHESREINAVVACRDQGFRTALSFRTASGELRQFFLSWLACANAAQKPEFLIIREDIAAHDSAVLLAKSEVKTAASIRTELLATVVDNIPSMIAYWDENMFCQYANDAYNLWFGRSPEEVIGMSMQELLGPELFRMNLPYIQGALAGVPQCFERQLTDANGLVRWSYAQYFPHRDQDGQGRGFFVLVSDISEIKRLEGKVKQAQALEVVGRLAGSLAHEMNTPLQIISDSIYGMELDLADLRVTLATLGGDERQERAAEMCAEESELLDAISASMDLAKSGVSDVSMLVRTMKVFADPNPQARTHVNIRDMLEAAVAMVRSLVPASVEVKLLECDHNTVVVGHAASLRFSFVRLLERGLYAVSQAQTIEGESLFVSIACKVATGAVKISVVDNGLSVPERFSSLIYEPLFSFGGIEERLAQGLAAARRIIVDEHGGELDCVTHLPRGSEIVISLPLNREA